MNAAELIALAERVEGLQGPCRETDVRIALATGSGCVERFVKSQNGDWLRDGSSNAPAYTASLDAAMTLVPEGCVFNVMNDFELPGRARIYGSVLPGMVPDRGWQADAATPALALTAAALRARAAMMEVNDE